MIHEIEIETRDEFYLFYQGHKTAILLDGYDETKYKKWETVILKSNIPRWKNIPLYKRISHIEYAGHNQTLLHLKS